MKPQSSGQHTFKTSAPTTSPWTDAYQARHADWSRDPHSEASHAYNDDTQRPTHDALSSIYNPNHDGEFE